jgi:hypothetical protein
MKKIYPFIISLVLSGNLLFAQSGFNKVVDSGNPVTTFTSPAFYKGAAWIDYDNDNDLDLFASPNFLFRNDGNGTFVQITNPFGFTPMQNPGGSSWADLNNDGFIDCIIAQYPSGVFLNNGNGTFTDISSQISNLNGFPAWGCAIGDWNKDAFADFVFTHAAGFHPIGPFPSKLYLNTNSSVTPQYITGYTLTDSTKPYTVPYWSDYDLDGDMDLFVASGPGGSPGTDFCYKNMKVETGMDTLVRMTSELFASQLQDGQCYNFIDFDNDGDLDLCLTNYAGASTRFYINNGGVYTLQTMPFTATTSNLTNDWGDFDNDGDLDVIITNDQQPAKYYKNNGNGTFAAAINLGLAGGSGVTNGDYDNDGDLDLFIHGNGNARALFRNDSAATGNNWINIKCSGTVSNKSALGTIVRLKATINGTSYWQMREINAQNSFQSQNDLRVHFGLGNATIVDSLIIKYSSGDVETFANVAPDIFYCNEEGSSSLCFATSVKENRMNESEIKIYPNPVRNQLTIELKNSDPEEEMQITISDACGKIISAKTCTAEKNSFMILTNSLAAGTYFLQAKGKKTLYNLKFVKE